MGLTVNVLMNFGGPAKGRSGLPSVMLYNTDWHVPRGEWKSRNHMRETTGKRGRRASHRTIILAAFAVIATAMWAQGSWTRAVAAAASPVGDLRLSYEMAEANGQTIPYHVYVPSGAPAGKAMPLVLVLHGYGGNADSPFEDAHGMLQREADRHGFVILSPNGYNGLADYGANLPLPTAIPRPTPGKLSPEEESRLAELDVLHTLDRVTNQFHIDPKRLYLMGNSMGMTGVLHFASKYPDRWCAISASGGPPWPDYPIERLMHLSGALFVHGGKDDLSRVSDSQLLVKEARGIGLNARLKVIPEGTHGDAWVRYLAETFDFFSENNCRNR